MLDSRPPRAWLHVYLLAAVALALPLFDVLADSPDFFVAQGAGPLEITALTLLCGLALPAALALLVGFVPALAAVVIGLLAGLYALRIVGTALAWPALPAIAMAIAFGIALAFGYMRWSGLRSFLSFASPIALLLPLWFLLGSPVSALVFPRAEEGAGGAAQMARLPIVLIVFDELPTSSLLGSDYRIDAKRFPSFARLADDAHWFPRATTVADFTTGSITGLLTGRYVDKKTIAHYRVEPENLYALLRDAYRFNVWERVTNLLPPELHASAARSQVGFAAHLMPLLADTSIVWLHALAPSDLRDRLPNIDSAWTGFAGLELRARGEKRSDEGWLDSLRKGDRLSEFEQFVASIDRSSNGLGTVHFAHVVLPHTPWLYLPSGRTHAPTEQREWRRRENAEALRVWARGPESRMVLWQQRHLLQTAAIDRVLGDLLDRLEAQGLYDEALIIVTADHGRAFRVGAPARSPTPGNEGEILLVPLLIKTPGQRLGVVSDADAELVDVLPSIADVLGVELPWPVDGRSLFRDIPDRPRRRVYSRNVSRRNHNLKSIMQAQRAALRRNAKRFSLGSDDADLFRFGPQHELIGQRAASVTEVGAPLVVELRDGAATFAVEDAGPLVASHVMGWLQADGPQPAAVAIVVDGVIAAVPRVERGSSEDEGRGRGRFEAFLPGSMLAPGEHRLEIRALSPGD